MAHNYLLQVSTGTEYDITKHQIIPVNSATPVKIESDLISAEVNVRIQNYHGLPLSSPTTSPYFSTPPHDKNKDQYSIAFRFSPKSTISGNDLVFGNDFDHPIRDRLPPGFSTAFKIVKWVVDPGLDGDVYADRPYLYGPAASSVNTLYVGDKIEGGKFNNEDDGEAGIEVEEGGTEQGMEQREQAGVPESEVARKKYFLAEEKRKEWEWEAGREYGCDFYNPYLDFNEFALKLPGFNLQIMKYWDGQGLRSEKERKRSHSLRYTLKNRKTDEVLFVVLFTLYLKEDVDEKGHVKEGVEGGKPFEMLDEGQREKHELMKNGEGESVMAKVEEKKEEKKENVKKTEAVETSADDLD